jgi:type VI protein secretion system component VasK
MGSIGLPEIMLILGIWVACMILIVLIPYWKIFGKAGFSPALSLLMVIPLVNIAMLYYLAFSDWPSHRRSPQQTPV